MDKASYDWRRRRLLQAIALSGVVPASLLAGEQPLIRRSIGNAGETLPVIGLGTSRVFDVHSEADRVGPREVLRILSQAGNAMLDTSPMYGEAERVSGDLLEELNVRDQCFLATKVWTHGRDDGIAQMNASMRLLRTRRIDLMQIHNLVDWQTHLRTLRGWQDEQRVRYIGITHYHAGAHDDVEALLKREPLDFLQINYSLAEPQAEQRLLPLAREKGVAVIINRPFARGSLFRATRGKPLPDWAAAYGIQSWAQFFLKWVVSHPAVTVAIPGTSKAKHMRDNLGAAQGALPDAAVRKAMAGVVERWM